MSLSIADTKTYLTDMIKCRVHQTPGVSVSHVTATNTVNASWIHPNTGVTVAHSTTDATLKGAYNKMMSKVLDETRDRTVYAASLVSGPGPWY